MPTSSVGPLGPYDLILQDKASSPSTTVGLMLDLDDTGAPRVREFRVPPVPPRQSQGFLADSSLDPLVDYIYVQDDWSGGAIRPYHREGDRRYAEADDVDARWEGVLALGMKSINQSIVIDNAGWETGVAGAWTLTAGSAGGSASVVTTAPRTDKYHLRLVQAAAGTASDASYNLAPNATSWRTTTCKFGVWAKSSASGTTGNIKIVDSSFTYTTNITSTDWTFYSVTATIASATTVATISINTSATATIDIDDMEFQIWNNNTASDIVKAGASYYMAVGPAILVLDNTNSPGYWRCSYVRVPSSLDVKSIVSYKGKVYVGYGSDVLVYGTDGSWTDGTGSGGPGMLMVHRNRLWRTSGDNTVSYSTSDPATSWGVEYTVGESNAPITNLYMLGDSVVVGTQSGLHTWFEDELTFRNVTNQFASDPNADNFSRGVTRGSWLYLTTSKLGLLRFNGYGLEDLSDLLIAPRLTNYGGRIGAITQDQHQLYMLMDTPTADTSLTKTTRLLSLRNVGNEWQLHTLADVDIAIINAVSVAGNFLYCMGRKSFGAVDTPFMRVLRFTLPQKSTAPYQDDIVVRDLVASGTINLPVFHAAGVASLIKVEMLVEDTDATNTVAVKFGVDGAAPSTTTLGTTTAVTTTTPAKVTMNASSLTTPTDAYGRMWQFQLVLTRDSAQAAGAHESPKVYAFVAHFVLAPTPVPAWEVYVRLGEGVLLKTGYQDPRGKTAILTDLNTLETQAYPITLVEDFSQDNSEASHYVRIRNWERILEDPEVHKGRPQLSGELYRLTLQKIV